MATPTQSTVIAAISLNPFEVNKSTGTALAGGYVYFWQDANRLVPKLVYQQELIAATNPPQYQYVALSDPLILSGVGTFVDNNGNEVAVYYWPYDANGNIQQYYIQVYDGPASTGLLQYTREAWPPLSFIEQSAIVASNYSNQISNSQFVNVLFIPPTLTLNYTGSATTTFDIAPNWTLAVNHTGAGVITVTQTAVQGSQGYPYNPPYLLTITAGANLAGLTLTQTFTGNPDWAAPQVATSSNGWINASILLSAGMTIKINYVRTNGAPLSQTILNTTNATAAYQQENATIQLQPAANTDAGGTGNDSIQLVLPVTGTFSFSNVQIVSLQTQITSVPYLADTINRQMDYLSHYYNPISQYEPIPSYLVGWDFANNPAQFLTHTVAAFATGANTSNYVWDQTIVFQTTNSGFTTSQGTSGALVLTSVGGTQLAVIQYIPLPDCASLVYFPLCVNVSAVTSNTTAVNATISLWTSTDGSLPSTIASHNSLVATLGANGKPATFHGNWVEIPRNGIGSSASTTSLLGDATFTVGSTPLFGEQFGHASFNGWVAQAGNASPKWLAIVVGTSTIADTKNISIQSISLQKGLNATIPAPESSGQTLQKCQAYYEKSFNIATLPANAVGVGTDEFQFNQVVATGNLQYTGYIPLQVEKFRSPTITTYSPINNTSVATMESGAAINTDVLNWLAVGHGVKAFSYSLTTVGASVPGDLIGVHWVADSRLAP